MLPRYRRLPLTRRSLRRLSTFAELGVDARVAAALESQGMRAPTEIQSKAAGPLLARKNTLVAAETGSGKTVAYLAPLLHNLLEDAAAAGSSGSGSGGESGAEMVGPRLLVLAPNRSLCAQVESVAGLLIKAGQLPLSCSARAAVASANGGSKDGGGRPVFPEVLVSSPAALLPPGVTPPLAQLQCVVMDEGDLLLRDGYVKDVARLLAETKVGLPSPTAFPA